MKSMIHMVIESDLDPRASVGAEVNAITGRDERDLRDSAVPISTPAQEAAPLLAVVYTLGIAISPDEGAGIADLELDISLMR